MLRPVEKVGRWCDSDDGGRTCFAYTSYFADGRVVGNGRFANDNKRFEGEGTWFHFMGKSCLDVNYLVYGNDDEMGEDYRAFFCNRIISLEGDVFVYETSDGEPAAMFRVSRRAGK